MSREKTVRDDEDVCHGPCHGGKCPVPHACERREDDDAIEMLGRLLAVSVAVVLAIMLAVVL